MRQSPCGASKSRSVAAPRQDSRHEGGELLLPGKRGDREPARLRGRHRGLARVRPAAEVAQAEVSLAALQAERPHAAARRTIGAGRGYALPGDVATAQASASLRTWHGGRAGRCSTGGWCSSRWRCTNGAAADAGAGRDMSRRARSRVRSPLARRGECLGTPQQGTDRIRLHSSLGRVGTRRDLPHIEWPPRGMDRWRRPSP